jgi:hypothetical protein
VRLRTEGDTDEAIGRALGLSRSCAHPLVIEELAKLRADAPEAAEKVRQLELECLDAILCTLARAETSTGPDGRVATGIPRSAADHHGLHEGNGRHNGPRGGGGGSTMQEVELTANLPPKRPRQAGTLAQVRMTLWWAVQHAQFVMSATPDATMRLRAVHAITQASMAYCKVQETIDLQARVDALEHLVNRRNGHGHSTP